VGRTVACRLVSRMERQKPRWPPSDEQTLVKIIRLQINLNIIQLIYLFYAPRLIQISILIHFPDQRINSIAWQIEN
jgi:hypothetical protein